MQWNAIQYNRSIFPRHETHCDGFIVASSCTLMTPNNETNTKYKVHNLSSCILSVNTKLDQEKRRTRKT